MEWGGRIPALPPSIAGFLTSNMPSRRLWRAAAGKPLVDEVESVPRAATYRSHVS